jgi:DNA-binding NarL/FixJ family response regulator
MALVLTASAERGRHARVVEAGAAGVLHKSVYTSDVIDAVRRLEAGEALLTANEVGEMLRLADQQRAHDEEVRHAMGSLTPREREVLQALAEGLSDMEMAQRLYISVGTARNHVARILSKLGVHSRLQALVFAARHGVVKID